MEKNRTLQLIQLEQSRVAAVKAKEKAEEQAKYETCLKAFAPIREMLDDVKDTLIMHHNGSGMIPLKDDLRDDPTRIEFWDAYGRGFEIRCCWGNCGPEYFVAEPGSKGKTTNLEEAQAAFVRYVATRVPKPEVKA